MSRPNSTQNIAQSNYLEEYILFLLKFIVQLHLSKILEAFKVLGHFKIGGRRATDATACDGVQARPSQIFDQKIVPKMFSTKIILERKIFDFIENFCIRRVMKKCFSLRPGNSLNVLKIHEVLKSLEGEHSTQQ